MEQQRLIGVITYIDYDKGFGFLSTNGYGIDKDDLNDKIQLYFKISSLENPEYIFESDWVTFILQRNNNPKHKRDSAISIRLINFDNADYLLSLQYRGIYANIFVRLASSMQSFNSNVSLSITNLFIEHSKYQIVVNTLTDFYQVSDDETRADIINALSNSAKIQKLLLNSEWGSNLIENTNRNTILIDMALCYINKYDAINFSKYVYAFNYDCIRQLAMPCIIMLSEGNNNVNMFFSNLSNDVIEKLFKSGGFNLSPEFRDIVFRKFNDVSVILNDCVIEKWNKLSENNEEALHSLWSWAWSPYKKFLSEIAAYISNSQTAGDYLKFTTLVEAKNIDCLLNIKDKDYSFCVDWIAKQSDRFISEFIGLSHYIPQKTLIGTIKRIGYERITNIFNVYRHALDDISIDQDFFNDFGINLIAIVDVLSEDYSSESRWVGGYWTWGEGMKKQDIETKTYLSIRYSFNLYVRSEHTQSISINNLNDSIVESVNKCLENKYKDKTDTSTCNPNQSSQNQLLDSCTSMSLPKSKYYWIMCLTDTVGRKRLVKLSIQDKINEPQSFSRIASFEEQYAKFLLNTTLVECDD